MIGPRNNPTVGSRRIINIIYLMRPPGGRGEREGGEERRGEWREKEEREGTNIGEIRKRKDGGTRRY